MNVHFNETINVLKSVEEQKMYEENVKYVAYDSENS